MTTPAYPPHPPERSRFRVLIDHSFNTFITPQYISGMYRQYLSLTACFIGIALMILIAIRGLIGTFLLVAGLIMLPWIWYTAVLTTRMIMEFVVIMFKIHGEIRGLRMDASPPEGTRE